MKIKSLREYKHTSINICTLPPNPRFSLPKSFTAHEVSTWTCILDLCHDQKTVVKWNVIKYQSMALLLLLTLTKKDKYMVTEYIEISSHFTESLSVTVKLLLFSFSRGSHNGHDVRWIYFDICYSEPGSPWSMVELHMLTWFMLPTCFSRLSIQFSSQFEWHNISSKYLDMSIRNKNVVIWTASMELWEWSSEVVE